MKTMLVRLAHDECFLVSPETARRIEQALPPNRYVTIIEVQEPEPHPLVARIARLREGLGPTLGGTFDQHRKKHEPMTEKQKELAKRFAKHLSKSKLKTRKRDDDDEDEDEDENEDDED